MNRRQLSSERIIGMIEEEWARTRPPGGVGTTEVLIGFGKLPEGLVDRIEIAFLRASGDFDLCFDGSNIEP